MANIRIKVQDTNGNPVVGASVKAICNTFIIAPIIFINTTFLAPEIVKDGVTDKQGIFDLGIRDYVYKVKTEVTKGLLYGEKTVEKPIPTVGIVEIGDIVIVMEEQPLTSLTTQVGGAVSKTTSWLKDNAIGLLIAAIAAVVGLALIRTFWAQIKGGIGGAKTILLSKAKEAKELLY